MGKAQDKYYQKNKNRIAQKAKDKYNENREQEQARAREYYQKNKDAVNKRRKEREELDHYIVYYLPEEHYCCLLYTSPSPRDS